MNLAFILMMVAYTSIDSMPISICIKVEDRNVDTIEINSVDEIRLQAFCKLQNEENWKPANVVWNVSNELEKCLSSSPGAYSSVYTLSLNSTEVDYGYIWISWEGVSISDTLYIKVEKCVFAQQFNNKSPKTKCSALNQYDLLGKYYKNINSNTQMLLLNNINKSIYIK
jgi:hypothetical protein